MSVLKLDGKTWIEKCFLARAFFSRFLGLMGRARLAKSEALFFPHCNSIHTFFMRFPIDVVFTTAKGEVVEIINSLPPWRMLLPRRGVKHCFEFAAGVCEKARLKKGSRLSYEGYF